MFPHHYRLPLLGVAVIALLVGGAVWYQRGMQLPDTGAIEVHVHSDILVYIGDTRLRFTDEKYQSSAHHILNPDFHFHDGNDDVIHRHAEGLTLATFFSSLGFTLTDDCFTTDHGEQYCGNGKETLRLFVNGEIRPDIAGYVPEEADRILLYFGDPNNPNIPSYLSGISDRACIYSYTCPERGTPPPEECGLTCEL